MTQTEVDHLRAENAELRRRIDAAETTIAQLRTESLERRAEVRALAQDLPVAMSRAVVLRQMANDVRHHPDKAGVARRAVRKARSETRRVVASGLRRLRTVAGRAGR